jgi:hypothetical protein
MKRPSLWAACVVAASVTPAAAQAPTGRIPLGTGATIVQTLSTPTAERESVHLVRLASDSGLHYEWRLEEVHANGDTLREEYRSLEAWTDIAGARRLRGFQDVKAPEAHPGYTMHALSRETYRRMLEGQRDSFQLMSVDQPPGSDQLRSLGFGGARQVPVRWRRGRCRRRGRRRLSGLATRCPAIPSSLRLLGILRLTLTPLAAPLGNRLLLLGRRGDAGIRLLPGLGAANGRRYRQAKGGSQKNSQNTAFVGLHHRDWSSLRLPPWTHRRRCWSHDSR